jgi:hypothetical protein
MIRHRIEARLHKAVQPCHKGQLRAEALGQGLIYGDDSELGRVCSVDLGRVLINRDWSAARLVDVRFTPESGHVRCTSPCPLWAKSGHGGPTEHVQLKPSM